MIFNSIIVSNVTIVGNFSIVRSSVSNVSVAYLPTLPVFPGVSKFFIKTPGLPVSPLIKMAPTLKFFGVVSRFLYSEGGRYGVVHVCTCN